MRGLAHTARIVLLVVALLLIGYLVVLAVRPTAGLPRPLNWFGQPASDPTIVVVFGVISLLCIVSYRSRRNPSSATVPVVIVVGLTATSFVLAFSSFLGCHDPDHPAVFTPLIWTASLLKGGVMDASLNGTVCPSPAPAALDMARLTILGAIFISLVGVATAVFRAQSDRLRAGLARSVTVVVDVDDDSQSMIAGIAGSRRTNSTLVLMTGDPDRSCIQDSRRQGARIAQVDFNRPESLGSHRFWRGLDRLYLLSSDPSTNLLRLSAISQHVAPVGRRRRVPLIVRIDDPWLAEAWRAQQFGHHSGGSDALWAADTVGKYEVTARRLIDHILARHSVRGLIICGTSQLTLALCGEITLRQTERAFYDSHDEPGLPALTLVSPTADEYVRDHRQRHKRKGFGGSPPPIDVVAQVPSVSLVSELIDASDSDPGEVTVIFADVASGGPGDRLIGTRLAASYPATAIYTWDPNAQVNAEHVTVVGELRTYRLGMDLSDGQAHDNFERAARLIHERWASRKVDRSQPAYQPWDRLSDFYKNSNRRQLTNALWMVEKIAGHTWNTWGMPPDPEDPVSAESLDGLEPLEKLQQLGFSEDAAYAMAKAEWEDWSRYYRKHGWTLAPGPNPQRDEANKRHEKLVDDWATTVSDPKLRDAAMGSLAGVLVQLRELGYRSRRMWQTYRRIGTVTAKRRRRAWTWTTESGELMHAAAGDWEVCDDRHCWSVRHDIFRATHCPVRGNRWERKGTVLARPARAGETIHTLEGPITAAGGDFVVQGDKGEQWPVAGDEFARRYAGPVPVYEAPDIPAPSTPVVDTGASST
jgi:hypothetical protein